MQLSLQKAIEEAKKNPSSDFSKQLRQAIESGQLDDSAQKQGVDLTKYGRAPVQKNNPAEKILDVTGGKEIAQGLGQAVALKENSKLIEQTQKEQFGIQEQLIKRIKEKKARGEDASRLEGALSDINDEIMKTGEGASDVLNPNKLTNKQVIGDALQLATTAGGAKLAGGVVGEAKTASGFVQGLKQGAISGAKGGSAVGALTGVSQGLQEDKDTMGIIGSGVTGAVAGGVSGGVLGGIIGGGVGALKGRELRNEVLKQQIASGEKVASKTKTQTENIKRAKQQGYDDSDIDFMTSMKTQDKSIAKRQIELAEKALKDKRITERPVDIVGSNFVKKAQKLETLNKKIGSDVDKVAKTLQGKQIDTSKVRSDVLSKLENANIKVSENGTLDFSNSVFKNVPKIQKEIQKAVSSIPDGSDAYQMHIFKKTLDEVVEYGVSGEGLKGNSKNILKAIRASADEALDSTFPEYNKVNTDFRVTKELLENAREMFGKKNGFQKEKGGQILRAIFSNRESRGRVIEMLKNFDDVGKKYKIGTKDNLVDQALFTEILEDVYGTQATTSLQGQTARAIRGTQKVIRGLRNPVDGVGELLATGAEKLYGITDERKRQVLLELLR